MKWTRWDSLAVLGLAIAPFVLCARLFVPASQGRVFFPDGDFIDQFYAFASLKTALVASGQWPLWNPFAYAGSPLWADIQAAVAYPPGLLVVLASAVLWGRLPLVALEGEAIVHLSLAGTFTYLFARQLLGSRCGAALAALSFALGGYLTGYPPLQLAILETDVWLPLALLGVLWSMAQRRRLPHPLLPAAWALAILAGHPQSALFVSVATLGYIAWLAVFRQPTPLPAEGIGSSACAIGPALGRRTALGERTVQKASASCLPFGRRTALAERTVQATIAIGLALGASAAGWLPAWQFWRLSNRAVSDYATLAHGFAPRELLGLVWPTISHWAPLYVGLVPFALALAAAWRAVARTDAAARHDRFWVSLALGALFLSLGGHSIVFPLFYRFVPGFALFRGQERAAFLVSFCLAILAGRGLTMLLARLPPIASRRRLAAAARPVTLMVVLAATAVDLGQHNGLRGWANEPPGELARSPVIASLAASDATRSANEDRLPANFGVLHAVESTSGASPLRLRRFEALYEALDGELEARRWDLLAVQRVLTVRPSLAESSTAQPSIDRQGVRQYVHRLREPNPRAWWVPKARLATDEAEALALVASAGIDMRQVVILESSAPELTATTAVGPPPNASVRVMDRQAGRIRIRTAASRPGWLVVSEMFYPGWRASLDGQPVPAHRANVALLAVAVPRGEHLIELRFTAPWVKAGVALTLLCGLLLAALFAAQRP